MSRSLLKVTTASAVAIVCASLGAGSAAAMSHRSIPARGSSAIALPTLQVIVNGTGDSVHGPRTNRAGRIKIVMDVAKSAGDSGGFESIESFRSGYSYGDYLKDFTYFYQHGGGSYRPTAKALSHLRRVYRHTHFYGGLAFAAGQTQRQTVVLPADRYFLDVQQPGSPTKLMVTGRTVARRAPATAATVTALGHHRFGGAKTLPHRGTITFANHDEHSIHVLEFRQIAKGTSQATINHRYAHLSNERSDAPPSWFKAGNFVTNYVKTGVSETLSYALPRGKYLLLDFTYDPRNGNEYAYEGMHRTVHLT